MNKILKKLFQKKPQINFIFTKLKKEEYKRYRYESIPTKFKWRLTVEIPKRESEDMSFLEEHRYIEDILNEDKNLNVWYKLFESAPDEKKECDNFLFNILKIKKTDLVSLKEKK